MIFWTISGHLFADDCVLCRNIDSLKDCNILQDDLNSLAQCKTGWQMKFNVVKYHSRREEKKTASIFIER